MMDTSLVVLAGALVGGFLSGLTGFGTGLSALPFWLQALTPSLASPLVVVCSLVAQLQTLPAIWHAIDLRRTLPFVAGGLLGVPAGTALLPLVSAQHFKIGVGTLLMFYCGFMLLSRVRVQLRRVGRPADALVGLCGGVLGGLAGLSGPVPTIWTGLRGWDKDARRGVLQAFNLAILAFALVTQAVAGLLNAELAHLVLIALPGTLGGAWLGRKVYNRLDTRGFDTVVLVLLMFSGAALLASALR